MPVVTFTRWTIVIGGAALTLIALGVDMAKVTLIARAVGVGIGFGLQNVVNNFVSGLILIVERPVGVGDLIERGPLVGQGHAHRHPFVHRANRAGGGSHRAQRGAGVEGSGELDALRSAAPLRHRRRRRYGFRAGTGDAAADRGGKRRAGDHDGTQHHRAMFKGFGDSSLNFTLLAWVATVDVGLQAQNALRIAILRKLESAGIAIPTARPPCPGRE